MNASLTWVPSLLGIALGMRHALEPDHLAAVSTLASEQRSARAGMWVGALWGVGHSVALLLVAGGLTLVEARMPPRLQLVFELLVAVMIVSLGVRAIRRAVREGLEGPHHQHRHGALLHSHAAPPAHLHLDTWTVATRPLVVGLLHGLAGSGALTALVFAELPSLGARLGYIALFGAGSVVGMALLTGLAGLPLLRASRKPQTAAAILAIAGVASVVVGLWWGFASGRELLG